MRPADAARVRCARLRRRRPARRRARATAHRRRAAPRCVAGAPCPAPARRANAHGTARASIMTCARRRFPMTYRRDHRIVRRGLDVAARSPTHRSGNANEAAGMPVRCISNERRKPCGALREQRIEACPRRASYAAHRATRAARACAAFSRARTDRARAHRPPCGSPARCAR